MACLSKNAKSCWRGVRVVTKQHVSLLVTKAWSKSTDWQASHQGTVRLWGVCWGSSLHLWVQRTTQGPWDSQKWPSASIAFILFIEKFMHLTDLQMFNNPEKRILCWFRQSKQCFDSCQNWPISWRAVMCHVKFVKISCFILIIYDMNKDIKKADVCLNMRLGNSANMNDLLFI